MTSPLRISVAMATYNGGRYICEQLESLAAQTRTPDELVISDNSSDDRTIDLARGFAQRLRFPVHILRNDRNLGLIGNFDRAVAACTGDIIFLCDQDDVWLPRKIAETVGALARHPSAGMAISNSELADQNLRPMGCTQYTSHNTHYPRYERVYGAGVAAVRFLIEIGGALGHTMAFRRTLRLVSPVADITRDCPHDAVRGILAASLYDVVALPTCLTLYRRHPGQVTSFRETPPLPSERLRRRLHAIFVDHDRTAGRRRQFARDMRTVAAGLESAGADPSVVQFLEGKARLAEFQANLPRSRLARVAPVFAILSAGQDSMYGNGLVTALRDLVIPGGQHS